MYLITNFFQRPETRCIITFGFLNSLLQVLHSLLLRRQHLIALSLHLKVRPRFHYRVSMLFLQLQKLLLGFMEQHRSSVMFSAALRFLIIRVHDLRQKKYHFIWFAIIRLSLLENY